MLARLMQLLEQSQGQIDLPELGQQLHAQPTAVAGMIDTLVRMGRLAEVRPACVDCPACAMRDRCILPLTQPRRIRVVGRDA